jgi:hypothetical protein
MAIKNKYYAQQMEDFNAGERGSSPEHFIIANATEPPNSSDTAELLKKYRAALITAYELGKLVKDVYGIVPPKVYNDPKEVQSEHFTISLTVN